MTPISFDCNKQINLLQEPKKDDLELNEFDNSILQHVFSFLLNKDLFSTVRLVNWRWRVLSSSFDACAQFEKEVTILKKAEMQSLESQSIVALGSNIKSHVLQALFSKIYLTGNSIVGPATSNSARAPVSSLLEVYNISEKNEVSSSSEILVQEPFAKCMHGNTLFILNGMRDPAVYNMWIQAGVQPSTRTEVPSLKIFEYTENNKWKSVYETALESMNISFKNCTLVDGSSKLLVAAVETKDHSRYELSIWENDLTDTWQFSQTIGAIENVSCISCSDEKIVVGTNTGSIYMYEKDSEKKAFKCTSNYLSTEIEKQLPDKRIIQIDIRDNNEIIAKVPDLTKGFESERDSSSSGYAIETYAPGKGCESSHLELTQHIGSATLFKRHDHCLSLVLGKNDGTIEFYQKDENFQWVKHAEYKRHTDEIKDIHFDNGKMYSSSRDNTLLKWE